MKSKHEWTREIRIHEFVDVEKIKVKMTQNNIVKISVVSEEDNENLGNGFTGIVKINQTTGEITSGGENSLF